jgi:hypothetical protein
VNKSKRATLDEGIFSRPVGGSIKWRDIEALFIELGADKGAATSNHDWLK